MNSSIGGALISGQFNCSDQPTHPHNITSIPDITGYGVFIGLVAPAVLTLFTLMAYYVIAYDPAMDPHRIDEEEIVESPLDDIRAGDVQIVRIHEEVPVPAPALVTGSFPEENDSHPNNNRISHKRNNITPAKYRYRPNPFDQLILHVVRSGLSAAIPLCRPFPDSWAPSRAALHQAFTRSILSLADIQSVTGLCMMTAGFCMLREGLSAFHWKFIIYTTWFCCATHLSAIVFLRSFLIHNIWQCAWRLTLMFLLVVVLVVGLVPTAHFFWELRPKEDGQPVSHPSSFAICFFNVGFGGSYAADSGRDAAILSSLVLVMNLVVRVLTLFDPSPWIRFKSLSAALVYGLKRSAVWCQACLGTDGGNADDLPTRLASNMIVAAHFVVCIWIDMVSSLASNIFWLILTLCWGMSNILGLWDILHHSIQEQDMSWSIGQILPVGLLALPALVLLEPWTDMFSKAHRRKPKAPLAPPRTSPAWNTGLRDDDTKTKSMLHHVLRLPTTSFSPEQSDNDESLLDPNLYDEYYMETAWMFWPPLLCMFHILSMAAFLIIRLDYSVTGTLLCGIPWLVLQQGSLLQFQILVNSFLSSLLRPKWSHHLIGLVTTGVLSYATWQNFFVYRRGIGYHLDPSYDISQFYTAIGMFALFVLMVMLALPRHRLFKNRGSDIVQSN